MKIVSGVLFALAMAFMVGCEGEKKAPLPPTPSQSNDNVSHTVAVTNAVAVLSGRNIGDVFEFAVDFTATANPPSRVTRDIKMQCDLRMASGIKFDFYCDDLSQFSAFSCYFKSGDGWYHGSFAPEENGKWESMTVNKSSCGVEGKPSGWGDVSLIRIAGWRAGNGKTRCALANLKIVKSNPDVAIVYAQSCAVKGGAGAKSYSTFAENVSSSLRAIGIEPLIVGDMDVTDETFAGMSAVILPYNPQITTNALAGVKAYSKRGGRILACYAQDKEVFDLLGVKTHGTKRPEDNGGAPIAGFLKCGRGLDGQPRFSTQASWMTHVPLRGAGVDVVAEWADGQKKSIGIPALVRTGTGLYMSHVWLGGVNGTAADLMRAVVCDLSGSLAVKISENKSAAANKANEVRSWMANQTSKPGEHRAFWCHNARGLGGAHNWDSSIKYLKANGFNAILANLAWGGAAFYVSHVLPVADDVATRGDAFDECLAACRKYGVEMHVWKVCWNMGTCTPKIFIDKMIREGRVQVNAAGKVQEKWLCPSHPANQKMEIDAMVELARKGADGIHFDYIRYPGVDSCFCAGCKKRFESRIGHSVTNWPGAVRGDKATLKQEWRDFRVDNITKVVSNVSVRARATAPGIKISAALYRTPHSDSETVAQDWPTWCRKGWIDAARNMDYVESSAMFRGLLNMQKAAVGKAKLYPGIGLSCWPNDGGDAVRLAKQIQVARELGLDGWTVFNYDRRAEAILPLLRTGITRED